MDARLASLSSCGMIPQRLLDSLQELQPQVMHRNMFARP